MSRRNVWIGVLLCLSIFVPGAARAALDLVLEATPDPAEPGDVVHVVITVSNPGGSTSGAVVLEMTYPTHFSFLSEGQISDGGGCAGSTCDPGETLTWSLGTLEPGQGITVSMTPAVSAAAGTLFTLSVEGFEGGVSRGTADQQMRVTAERVLDLAVDESRDPTASGSKLTYSLTYGNRSAMSTTDTELRLPIPAGTSFLSATDGGVQVGGAVVWDLGTLTAHDGGRREVTLQVGGGVGAGTLIAVDRATLTGDGNFQSHQTRTPAVTRVENGSPLVLAVSVNPDPAPAGEPLRTVLTVANRGTGFLHGVTLQLR